MIKQLKKTTIFLGIVVMLLLLPVTYATACTGFTYSEKNKVLVGSNEDWYDYDFWIRFLLAENDTYGRLIIENHWPIPPDPNWHCPQVGMNDQGLFYDCFATPSLMPVNSSSKPYYYNSSDYYKYSLESYCLSVCSTIDEVIDIYDDYNLEHMENYQVLWVDNTGESIIIEGDDIIFKQGDYQVVTNFIQTHPELGGYPCWRYNTAVNMLENMYNFSVEYFTSICNATHQTGTYPSVYSGVYDLNEEILYLYYFYDYDNVVVIDLNEELLLGEHVYYLADLFEGSNSPPNKPLVPSGPYYGKIREEITYQSEAIDPDEDQLHYLFSWGDGTDSGWLGPINSGETFEASHTWKRRGIFDVRVRARDTEGLESEWSDPLWVTIPRERAVNCCFFLNFLKNHPNLLPILRCFVRIVT
jgi:choloylglycine hydrolase